MGEAKKSIGTLIKWTEINQLQINPSKNGFYDIKLKMMINNKDAIEKSKSLKFLDVHISYYMNWD